MIPATAFGLADRRPRLQWRRAQLQIDRIWQKADVRNNETPRGRRHSLSFAEFVWVHALHAIARRGGLCISLYRWDLFHPPHFVGLTNFKRLLGWSMIDGRIVPDDSRFWKYLGNTVYFMLIIPISMAGSLILAMMLNLKLRGRIIYRTIFFLPSVSFGVGLMLLWRYMYEPEIGLLNTLLSHFGINGPDWLGSYNWAKPAIMNMNLWATIGGTNMILYLAGLQGIPIELYEAAEVDGAGLWQRFFSVTLPMLMPTTFFILVTSIIVGLQGDFDTPM